MILMAVAIVCGLGASYMTSRLLADREEAPAAAEPPPERVTFLVAKVNLDHGAALKNPQEMFVEKSANKDDAPKDTVTELKVLKGKFLKRGLRKGDHITSEDLVDEKTSILANLPDGYQAYGIQVDPASIAAGWASLPGSKVNILWTMRGGRQQIVVFQAPAGETCWCWRSDGQLDSECDEGKAMPAQVVTVALKTTDTMKVKLAQLYGPLTLTLRKYGDTAPPPEEMVFQGEELFKTGLPSKNDKKRLVGSNSSETPRGFQSRQRAGDTQDRRSEERQEASNPGRRYAPAAEALLPRGELPPGRQAVAAGHRSGRPVACRFRTTCAATARTRCNKTPAVQSQPGLAATGRSRPVTRSNPRNRNGSVIPGDGSQYRTRAVCR